MRPVAQKAYRCGPRLGWAIAMAVVSSMTKWAGQSLARPGGTSTRLRDTP